MGFGLAEARDFGVAMVDTCFKVACVGIGVVKGRQGAEGRQGIPVRVFQLTSLSDSEVQIREAHHTFLLCIVLSYCTDA